MDKSVTPKQALKDIFSLGMFNKKLLDPSKDYYPLLKLLDDNDYYPGDLPYPDLKTMERLLGITHSVLGRWILTLFKQMLSEINSPVPINFLTVVEFYFQGYSRHMTLLVEGLDYLPRVGETIYSSYFSEYLGGSFLYFVESINHHFDQGEHRITMFIKNGNYNLYWHLRKDEALATKEISIQDEYEKSDEQLKTLLRISPHYVWLDDENRRVKNERIGNTKKRK